MYIALLPHNEWSGALFYKVEGNFDTPVFKIICQDVLIMDIGQGAHTQFDTERLIADYMADKPELLDCYNGLIHSHHMMGAFFSGEDTGTLHQEGINRNNFVSLVVDTRGTYVAAITRRVEAKTVFTPHSTASYPFYSLERVPMDIIEEPSAVIRERHIVECFPLTVVRHEISDADVNEYIGKFAALLQPMLGYRASAAQAANYQSFAKVVNGYEGYGASASKPVTPSTIAPTTVAPTTPAGVKAEEVDIVDAEPQLPFPGQNNAEEDLPEDVVGVDTWGLAAKFKGSLWFNRVHFDRWLITLFSGTPLLLYTEHTQWTTAAAERILTSWRESLNQEEFEVFCATWVPYYVGSTDMTVFFDEKEVAKYPELNVKASFILDQVFFLYLREVFNSLEYDAYVEAILEMLKSEFDYTAEN